MYNSKALLSMAALAGTALAQSTRAPACVQSESSLIAAAPSIPAELSPYLIGPLASGVGTAATATTTLPPDTFADPDGYVDLLCSVAGALPTSLLPEYASWGSALLSYGSVHLSEYDVYVTNCIATGEAAATLTSQLHSLLTGTGGLCQATATPTAASNGTAPVTSGPTPTGATSVVTAAAARPTGVLVGAAAMGGLVGAAALL